jgi:hypothetical protein
MQQDRAPVAQVPRVEGDVVDTVRVANHDRLEAEAPVDVDPLDAVGVGDRGDLDGLGRAPLIYLAAQFGRGREGDR